MPMLHAHLSARYQSGQEWQLFNTRETALYVPAAKFL
jgi:hypothetical protein